MKSQLSKSHAAEYFTKWSNRYALTHAWQFRSGRRLVKSGNASADWKPKTDPCGMFVMRGSYRQEQSIKGNETWTGSDSSSQREAEELFTVLTTTNRKFESVFSPTIFSAPNNHGHTNIAQAIVYNAKPQESANGPSKSQPIVGWDTLNWNPSAAVSEWGAPPLQDSARWPWEIFEGLKSKQLVKLNWQPKLVLVTKSRLEQAIDDSESNVAEAMQLAIDHAELLSH